MQAKDLKMSVVNGVFWKLAERFLAQGVTFIVSLELARILLPEDYGVISILTIFITFANVFVADGFSAALVQKKDCDSLDYSSVLISGMVISLVLYGILFFFAPAIASFYNMPILSPTLRVLALRIPLSSINSVQIAYLSKNMQFKKFFWATFFGTVGSAIVGLFMAYSGFGVWSLVGQNLFNYTVDILILAIAIKKIPEFRFSFNRVKKLIDYGYKILLTNLFFTFTDQLRSFVIGKKYSSADLAFYTKGKSFPQLIGINISGPLSAVLFPAMSKKQNDIEDIKNMMRKSVQIITYVVPPILLGFAQISEPLVKLVLTEKWLPCVPYIWIGCVYYVFSTIHTVNLEAVKAIGRSDQVFKYGIIKRIVGIVTLLISLPFGIKAVAMSLVASAFIATVINAFQNKQLFNYKYTDQFLDIFLNITVAVIMCLCVGQIGYIFKLSEILTILIKMLSGIIIYLLISIIVKNKSLTLLLSIINQFKKNSLKQRGV